MPPVIAALYGLRQGGMMNLNELLPELDRLEDDGAVIVLKWDGERKRNKKTIVILRPGTDYQFRLDSDDLVAAIKQGIEDYDEKRRKEI